MCQSLYNINDIFLLTFPSPQQPDETIFTCTIVQMEKQT